MSGDCFHDGYDNRVAKLFVCLCVRHRNDEGRLTWTIKSHQSSTLTRRQTPGISSRLADENLGPILVVSGRKCSRDILRSIESKSEAIAFLPVLLGIVLKLGPHVIG